MRRLGEIVEDAAAEARRRLLVALTVAACGLAAVGFAAAAAYLGLAGVLGAPGAAVILAAVFAAAGLGVALIGAAPGDRGRRDARRERRFAEFSDDEALAELIAAFLTGFRAAGRPR